VSDDKPSLAVVYDDDQVVVHDERRTPVLCKDCRFSGWLREYDFSESWPGRLPTHCLHYSGGAEPSNGSRVFDETCVSSYHYPTDGAQRRYPHTHVKNHDGQCTDFVPAKKIPWWKRIFRSARRMRE
jgi:hypothetical protein